MFSQVFAGTSKCKSWTSTRGLFPIDDVCLPFGACDCDDICVFLYVFECCCRHCLELASALAETFDAVLEVEGLCLSLLDVGYQLGTIQEICVRGKQSPCGFSNSFH